MVPAGQVNGTDGPGTDTPGPPLAPGPCTLSPCPRPAAVDARPGRAGTRPVPRRQKRRGQARLLFDLLALGQFLTSRKIAGVTDKPVPARHPVMCTFLRSRRRQPPPWHGEGVPGPGRKSPAAKAGRAPESMRPPLRLPGPAAAHQTPSHAALRTKRQTKARRTWQQRYPRRARTTSPPPGVIAVRLGLGTLEHDGQGNRRERRRRRGEQPSPARCTAAQERERRRR